MNSIARFLNWTSPDLPKNDDKQYIGIGGFRTFVAITEGSSFTATAPDIVCEDLTTVQDSIINSPKIYSMTGEVADIFIENTPEQGLGSIVEKVLNVATPYIPNRTLSQIQKINEQISKVENVIDNVNDVLGDVQEVFDIVGNRSSGSSIKEKFFSFIERIYDTKTIINIENNSGVKKQVLITGFSDIETNDGDTLDFSITFKEIRIASIGLFRNNQNLTDAEQVKINVNSTLKGQLDSQVDKGISDGIQVSASRATQLLGSL